MKPADRKATRTRRSATRAARARASATVPPGGPAETRERILHAARDLFARHGFAATSIKDISTASGRNSALIHYYFDSKDSLYRAVLDDSLESGLARLGAAFRPGNDPRANLRAFVQAQQQMLEHNPELLHLMVREMLDAGAVHAEQQIHTLGATVFARLRREIESGQRIGAFRRDIDARFAAISLVAQLNWFTLARPAVGVLLNGRLGAVTGADTEAFAAHLAELFIAGLEEAGPRTPNSQTRRQK